MIKGEGAILIGLGHKARHGKDYSAEYIKELLGDRCAVLRFSDALYKECENKNSVYPLILNNYSLVLFLTSYFGDYKGLWYSELPESMKNWIVNHMTNSEERRDKYHGMPEKDPILLQWWGTDFRRKYFGDDYWVEKIKSKASEIDYYSKARVIAIPDVRFKNEYEFIKRMGGIYIDVQRLNEDGTLFVASDRDPNHESETDLDGIEANYIIKAVSGDTQSIKNQIEEILIKEDIWTIN